jgi:hypothetical protein
VNGLRPSNIQRQGIGLLLTIFVVIFSCSSGSHSLLAQTTDASASQHTYSTDYNTIKQLGTDLYESLKPSFRAQITQNPIWFVDDARPYIRPFHFESDNNAQNVVYVSKGFIQLVNNIAHAKAIDKFEPGFFNRYLKQLAEDKSGLLVPELENISDAHYWTDDVMNEQMSYFNQIVGVVAAINLAHHYLGHEEKYADLLQDSASNPVTMATTCTQAEWEQAFKLGAINALDCGFTFEGIKAFYDCILAMEKRPGWTLYFLPMKARIDNLSKLKKTLGEIEFNFFGKKL